MLSRRGWAYEAVRYHVVLLQHVRGHLGVLVVVVVDEVFVAHAGFLLDEDAGFDDFAEACGVGVAGFEDHGEVLDGVCERREWGMLCRMHAIPESGCLHSRTYDVLPGLSLWLRISAWYSRRHRRDAGS